METTNLPNHDLVNRNLENIFLDFYKFREENLNVLLRVVQQVHAVATPCCGFTGFLEAFFAMECVVHVTSFMPCKPLLCESHEERCTAVAMTHAECHVVVERLATFNPKLSLETYIMITELDEAFSIVRLHFGQLVYVFVTLNGIAQELASFRRGHLDSVVSRCEIAFHFILEPFRVLDSALGPTRGFDCAESVLVLAVELAIVCADMDGEVPGLGREVFGEVFLRLCFRADSAVSSYNECKREVLFFKDWNASTYAVATTDSMRLLVALGRQELDVACHVVRKCDDCS